MEKSYRKGVGLGKGVPLFLYLLLLLYPSRAATVLINESFEEGIKDFWLRAGSCRFDSVHKGLALVEDEQHAVGSLTFGRPLDFENIRAEASFVFKGANRGFGEGVAIAFLAVPSAPVLGEGRGLLGIGNLVACEAALVVEIDLVSNAQEDFGPIGAGYVHVGLGYSPSGPIRGDLFLPTFAEKDISELFAESENLSLLIRISKIGKNVWVECGNSEKNLQVKISESLDPYFPFPGFLCFSSSNGPVAGQVLLRRVKVETDIPPPPVFTAFAQEQMVELSWSGGLEDYAGFRLWRNAKILADLPCEQRSFTDNVPGPGLYVYRLRAYTREGDSSPPACAKVFVGKPFLVFDPGVSGDAPSPAARAWLESLSFKEVPAIRVNSLKGLSLEEFAAVLCIGGSGRAQRPLNPYEEEKLGKYAQGFRGARLFLEGADLWSMPRSGLLPAVDGVRCAGESWPTEVVMDRDGMPFAYEGNKVFPDELEPSPEEVPGNFVQLWKKEGDTESNRALALAVRRPYDEQILINSSIELFRIRDPNQRLRAAEKVLEFLSLPTLEREFRRGDASDDGSVNIADAIAILAYLFAGKDFLPCLDAADVNDDGEIQISDCIGVLAYLFTGAKIPRPGPDLCGRDPTPDLLPLCAGTACSGD